MLRTSVNVHCQGLTPAMNQQLLGKDLGRRAKFKCNKTEGSWEWQVSALRIMPWGLTGRQWLDFITFMVMGLGAGTFSQENSSPTSQKGIWVLSQITVKYQSFSMLRETLDSLPGSTVHWRINCFLLLKLFSGSHGAQGQLPVFQQLPLTFSNRVTTSGTEGAESPKISHLFCNVNTSYNFENTRVEIHLKNSYLRTDAFHKILPNWRRDSLSLVMESGDAECSFMYSHPCCF